MPAIPPDLASEETTLRSGSPNRRASIGMVLGLGTFLSMLLLPPPAGMEMTAWRTAAVGVLMAIWWISEPIPIPVTALLPLALFPLLGVASIEAAAAPYANSVIFLFLGGFLIAEAMQRWELHRRIALLVILTVGTAPVRLVGGFMVATGLLSMWVSNTATAVMMMPIGLSIVQRAAAAEGGGGRVDANFAKSVMLGIAYAASIGGLGTLIGSPPNALLAGYMMDVHGVEVGFGQWMLIGLPIVVIGIPIGWLVLMRIFPNRVGEIPGGEEAIRLELRKLGRWTRGERRVAIVFVAAATAWIFRPLLDDWVVGLTDPGIAIVAGVLLFLLPVDRRRGIHVLEWADARGLPWDVLVLFGGGLSLAASIGGTGLAGWIGDALVGLRALPIIGIILAVTLVVIFLTELTSNTATAAAFLPVVGSLAVGIGQDPILLTVPAALAATCAFMMPVGTPPNAIVYATGQVRIQDMMKAGFYLNTIFAVLITLVTYVLLRLVFVGS